MQSYSAKVKNGRLVLNEPCALPEGQVVVLLPLEELMAAAVDVDDEMPLLHIAPPPREFKKKRGMGAADIIDELRSL